MSENGEFVSEAQEIVNRVEALRERVITARTAESTGKDKDRQYENGGNAHNVELKKIQCDIVDVFQSAEIVLRKFEGIQKNFCWSSSFTRALFDMVIALVLSKECHIFVQEYDSSFADVCDYAFCSLEKYLEMIKQRHDDGQSKSDLNASCPDWNLMSVEWSGRQKLMKGITSIEFLNGPLGHRGRFLSRIWKIAEERTSITHSKNEIKVCEERFRALWHYITVATEFICDFWTAYENECILEYHIKAVRFLLSQMLQMIKKVQICLKSRPTEGQIFEEPKFQSNLIAKCLTAFSPAYNSKAVAIFGEHWEPQSKSMRRILQSIVNTTLETHSIRQSAADKQSSDLSHIINCICLNICQTERNDQKKRKRFQANVSRARASFSIISDLVLSADSQFLKSRDLQVQILKRLDWIIAQGAFLLSNYAFAEDVYDITRRACNTISICFLLASTYPEKFPDDEDRQLLWRTTERFLIRSITSTCPFYKEINSRIWCQIFKHADVAVAKFYCQAIMNMACELILEHDKKGRGGTESQHVTVMVEVLCSCMMETDLQFAVSDVIKKWIDGGLEMSALFKSKYKCDSVAAPSSTLIPHLVLSEFLQFRKLLPQRIFMIIEDALLDGVSQQSLQHHHNINVVVVKRMIIIMSRLLLSPNISEDSRLKLVAESKQLVAIVNNDHSRRYRNICDDIAICICSLPSEAFHFGESQVLTQIFIDRIYGEFQVSWPIILKLLAKHMQKETSIVMANKNFVQFLKIPVLQALTATDTVSIILGLLAFINFSKISPPRHSMRESDLYSLSANAIGVEASKRENFVQLVKGILNNTNDTSLLDVDAPILKLREEGNVVSLKFMDETGFRLPEKKRFGKNLTNETNYEIDVGSRALSQGIQKALQDLKDEVLKASKFKNSSRDDLMVLLQKEFAQIVQPSLQANILE